MTTRAQLNSFIASDDFSINQHSMDSVLNRMLDLMHPTPAFVVGVEAANIIEVNIQLNDFKGAAFTSEKVLEVWLSDTAGGADTSTGPTVGTSATTGTVMHISTAKIRIKVKTDSTGLAVIALEDAGTPTFWLNVDINGEIFSAPAITFA